MKYEIIIYPTEHVLTVYIDKNIDRVDEEVREVYDDVYFEPLSETTKAFSFTAISNYEKVFVIGITRKSPDKEILHEIIHITWYIAKTCGFKYNEDPEFQCYLAEYLFNEVKKIQK